MATTPASNSHASAARLSILDLPSEILTQIFSYFAHERIDSYGNWVSRVPWRDEQLLRHTQNARLVCRVFHRSASPNLLPVLRIPIEKESLDFMDSILNRPFLLEGVRIIKVSTLYRPKEIARSLDLFRERRLRELHPVFCSCSIVQSHKFNDKNVIPLGVPKQVYDQAAHNHDLIRSAWRQDSHPGKTDIVTEATMEYQRILEQGHAEYRKKHEEQLRLITDGSFVSAVATLASHVPNQCSLSFIDDMWESVRRYIQNPTRVFNDTNELLKFLSTPHGWTRFEFQEEGLDFSPSTVLATLPLACQQRGLTIHGLHSTCLPYLPGRYGFGKSSGELLWDDLETSCKQLKAFTFGLDEIRYAIRLAHPDGKDKACIDRYFGAMLSSPHLEYLQLHFGCSALNHGTDYGPFNRRLPMEMGSVISKTQYPFLQKARIGYMLTQDADLESFCNGLGQRLQSLYLHDIELAGTWTNVLDILRRKFSTRCLEGSCKITLAKLFGGEFGAGVVEQERRRKPGQPLNAGRPLILEQAEKYVNGDSEMLENPLRRIEVHISTFVRYHANSLV